MRLRVGIVALQHEANAFLGATAGIGEFERSILAEGEEVRQRLAETHHEVGGFFAGLEAAGIEAVPVFAARATPHGPIAAGAAAELVRRMHAALDRAGELDGLLAAPHGAATAEREDDFDGAWLAGLRARYPRPFPIIGTLDLHGNLSARQAAACDALIPYRTNPHLDQRQRGEEAAALMVATLAGKVRPTMAAAFLPLAVNIERQASDEPQWRSLRDMAERQRAGGGAITNGLMYGFPYADAPHMGAATIAVTNDDAALAQRLANDLAREWWARREEFEGRLIGAAEAVAQAAAMQGRICLLDMGDNVGGGSPGDGTTLLHALAAANLGPVAAAIYDPASARAAIAAGVGAMVDLAVGGRTDDRHGKPFAARFTVRNISEGRFTEREARHGGASEYDQGPTATVESAGGITLAVNSRRTAPFSLAQLTSAGIEPRRFRVFVAKGAHAPVAAYREVCDHFVRVNTPGATAADLSAFTYRRRRRPMWPFEREATWEG